MEINQTDVRIERLGEKKFFPKPTTRASAYMNALMSPANKPVLDYLLNTRGFSLDVIKRFQLGANEVGEVTIPIFKDGDLIDYKFRGIKEKTFHRISGAETWVVNDNALTECLDSGYLIITEGEFDAMAVYQLGMKSVVSGTGGAQSKELHWLDRIPDGVKIYINTDNDEPGQLYARTLADRLGIERCYNVLLPTKDANDYLRDGGTLADYQKHLAEAKRFNVQDIFKLQDALEQLKNNKIERFPTGIQRLDESTEGGIPKKSMIILSGESGIGKSTMLMNILVNHANDGHPVLLVSLENDMQFTLRRLIEIKYRQRLETISDEQWATIHEELASYPFYIDMSMNTSSMKKIEKVIDQAKKLYGIEVFGFDHIGFLPKRENATQEIAKLSMELKLMAVEKDIITYVISHIRKKQPGQKFITGEDLKDSSSLKQDADMVLLVVPVERDTYCIHIDKARMSRSKLDIPIKFDRDIGLVMDDMTREVTSFREVIRKENPGVDVDSLPEESLGVIDVKSETTPMDFSY